MFGFFGGLSNKGKIILTIVLVAVLAAAVFWFWSDYSRRDLEKQLKEVEEKISETQKEIDRLSSLSPEELAERERELAILSAQSAADDVAVDGVEITKEAGKKIVKNIAEGYTLELPTSLVMARTISADRIEFHDRETMCQGDPLCGPVILIEARRVNPAGLSLEDWFKAEEKAIGSPIYSPREEIIIGGAKFYKVTESLPPRFDGYYYYWANGEKIYYLRISKFSEPNYRSYFETLRLL